MIVGNRAVRAMNEETEVTSQNGTDSSGAGSGTSALEAEAVGKTSQWMCAYVKSHPEDVYPESLRTFLEDNPEAAEFVFLYPEYHGTKQEIDLSGEIRKGEIPLLLRVGRTLGIQGIRGRFSCHVRLRPNLSVHGLCELPAIPRWIRRHWERFPWKSAIIGGCGTSWIL
ncbi:MAG: hypothetical protein V8S96_03155 [Lachnospiraceae bacterium]